MPSTPMPLSKVMLAPDLTVMDADAAYPVLLARPIAAIMGQPLLAAVHQEDRAAAAAILADALATGEPRVCTVRYVRGDDSLVWVYGHVSRLGSAGAYRLAVTCMPLAQRAPQSTVAAHWQLATQLLLALQGGRALFGEDLISTPPAEILLILYLAEAEVRTDTAGTVAARIGQSWRLACRWFDVLIANDLVEPEADGPLHPDTPLRLTRHAETTLDSLLVSLAAPPAPAPA